MFLIMGFIHIVASGVLLLSGSEPTLYFSQLICGLVEFFDSADDVPARGVHVKDSWH